MKHGYILVFCDGTGTPLSGTGSYTIGSNPAVNFVNGIPVTTNAQTVYSLVIQFVSCEPLIISPFLFGAEVATPESALSGISQIQLQCAMQSPQLERAYCS